ncbi:phosphatidate phosphatase LPIN2-like isoform X1 [Conger conger]|uniref:phosphatidate phosphatase LPIN2-like isoform X1 n=2 Tax=Conger conger TaxID=82655 RepID=UPI002A59BAFF|nr:phosphatidate phosphatase LPIN2-like isoform X1 [Conger conger]
MAAGGSRGQSFMGKVHLHPSLWSQTMNYVGQLAETVLVTVKELYRGLNPATLSGGIDVIVVRQPDGSLQCSPFHVRFGKLGVLRSKEKVVDIEINGEPVELHMKLGDNGEAFFVEENEHLEERVPAHLCTSPISMEGAESRETSESPPSTQSRRKKRRRKRIRSDPHLREDGGSSSDDRDATETEMREEPLTPSLASIKSVYYSISEEPYEEVVSAPARTVRAHSDGEVCSSESVYCNRPPSPKSDSELLVKPQETSEPEILWQWGGFPKVYGRSERTQVEVQRTSPLPLALSCSQSTHFRTIQRQDSFDMDPELQQESGSPAGRVTVIRPEPRPGTSHRDSPPTEEPPGTCYSTPNLPPGASYNNPNPPPGASYSTPDSTLGPSHSTPDSTLGPSHSTPDSTLQPSPLLAQNPSESPPAEPEAKPSLLPETDPLSLEQRQVSCPADRAVDGEALQGAADWEAQSSGQGHRDSEVVVCLGVGEEEGEQGSSEEVAPSPLSDQGLVTKVTDAAHVGENELQPESQAGSAETAAKDTQDKKRGKRSQHLGPSDIYLDDLSNLDPEVAALYFPKSEAEAGSRAGAEPGSHSGNQSPQSVGSGAMDSGTEYLSDSTGDQLDVTMSLCGRVVDTSHINKEKFNEHLVGFQDLVKNPGIIEDPNLVICINSNYYNWAVAAPMVLSMQAFQKNLPKSSIEQLVKDRMPKKSGRWWFSWRRRDMDTKQLQLQQASSKLGQQVEQLGQLGPLEPDQGPSTLKEKAGQASSDEDRDSGRAREGSLSDTLSASQCFSQIYRKSLRLTTEQIEQLNLREGANKVVFSVTTQYQGTCRCEAAIYLWNWDDKVVISDIDGTITKSDALGHILPQLGKDWTHHGIARLYHKIHQNGYKFLYCSARAIGMADITKGYLQWVNDRGTVLPKGPVLLAPSSLFSALHREVIEKKPEVFKVACLTDIRDLFSPHRQPFYAAFGNRTNDAYAYKQVGVIEARIFTVNPRGELIQEKTKGNKSTYSRLSELVDHVFPLFVRGRTSSFDYPEFSHFSFWREPLPPVDLSALL